MRLVNGDIRQFLTFIKDKRLIAFGAGEVLHKFVKDFSEFKFEKKISYIVDNSPEKVGISIDLEGQKIPVVSVNEIKKKRNIVVLISCGAIAEVYKQLDSYSELSEVFCWVVNFIRSETNEAEEKQRQYPIEYKCYEEMIIPKVIHYCWFGKNEIPEKNLKCIESWKKFCPDYRIILWNEDNYDVKKNEYMYQAYKEKKWAFVSDYVRLDVVYQYGGIYLDTDVEIIKSLDELLYQDAYMGIDHSKRISLGLGFGAKRKYRIIRELLEMYNELRFVDEQGHINMVAAPTMQMSYFNRLGYINNGELQRIDDLTVYPEKVLSAKCNWTGRILPTKHSFTIHHYDGTWTEQENKKNCKDTIELFNTIGK